MERYHVQRDVDGAPRVEVPHRGATLLRHPLYNKGTAFTREERVAFGLEGLLPEAVNTLDQQVCRVRANLVRKEDPLERYVGLAALQDRNETLFYRLLLDNLEELLPIVYTPTVGQACQEFSRIFRRGRGLWINPGHRGRIEQVLGNAPFEDVRLVVVTDNEILGLGDQGAGGMGIPMGKLALYTVAAGIHPALTLPVSLDVGTDNKALLQDDLYLGWRQPRLRGAEYDALVDEFVWAVKKRFPGALLQWEDFKKGNAFRLLEAYRHILPSFNDDIQGTGAVTLAAILAAERITGTPLTQERIVILGAGAAGIGIARFLRSALRRAGAEGEDLLRAVAILDREGLLVDDAPIVDTYQWELAWPGELAARAGLGPERARQLEAVVEALRPTVLIGVSGEPGTFTRGAVRTMANHARRPVILPLSNPTSKSEATPEDLLAWTDGRALVATGSPFPSVTIGTRSHRIAQANNAFVFPAIGLACVVGELWEVTDGMFQLAAKALANEVSEDELGAGRLLPKVRDLRRVTARVAEAVLREARASAVSLPFPDEAIPSAVAEAMWVPRYAALTPTEPETERRVATVHPVGAVTGSSFET
jgi:malate dehydrogenase (oxaloacetate-decarboxylating)